ncbi:MAG: valine--tRNA ligase [Bacillota bacterium]|nr:valine--tRNA ligase [Bacillota bacterium]
MHSKYNPNEFEGKVYQLWLDQDCFHADPASDKPPFSMVLPPPNITGRLHIGHAYNHTLQDILVRFKRMSGFETLWLPGTDHASIATEALVLRMLKETKGITKQDMTREEFLDHAWAWREKYGYEILSQMKLLGDSCDWSKLRFTMDEGCHDAVIENFVSLYEKGYVYKGERQITWCPSCHTTISDAEVDREERDGSIHHIRYPYRDGDGYVEVATTRPETMFGDVAIAVHPQDPRYTDLIGKTVINPVNGKELPVIADEAVEIEFGTGALKITPAHDETDYAVGLRHNLPIVDAFHSDATMNALAGRYEGLDRYEARKRVIAQLKESGHLIETKPHRQAVGTCSRCHTDVEPRMSDQWFVAMEELAKPALEAYHSGKLKFHPDNYAKIYLHWLENIRDWNISRQLWWGHRIPAYYCDGCKKMIVARETPDRCPDCGSESFTQDTDVLDTWFSSALWPFSTMGWPEKTPLRDKFYPTDTLITGYDIIFLWVVRMVFESLEQTGELPFRDVIINGLVRDKNGRKMSKSAGNGIDPIEMIEEFGADALRFSLVNGNSMGADMRIHREKIEVSRNFANKLWNASRFVITGLDVPAGTLRQGNLDISDRWILTRLQQVIREVTAQLDRYDFGLAASTLYDFIWSEYCDWYIELSKKKLYSEDPQVKASVQWVLVRVLRDILKLIHPFMPFITEEIAQHLDGDGYKPLAVTDWPVVDTALDFGDDIVQKMERIMDAIRGIRNVRAEMNVPNSRKANCLVLEGAGIPEILLGHKEYLVSLANCSEVTSVASRDQIPANSVAVHVKGAELYLPLNELIDIEKEKQRLQKEIAKLEQEVARIDTKLSNPGFTSKAPEKVIEDERKKMEEYKLLLENVTVSLRALS